KERTRVKFSPRNLRRSSRQYSYRYVARLEPVGPRREHKHPQSARGQRAQVCDRGSARYSLVRLERGFVFVGRRKAGYLWGERWPARSRIAHRIRRPGRPTLGRDASRPSANGERQTDAAPEESARVE